VVKKITTILLPVDDWTAVKHQAIEERTSMSGLIRGAIIEYLARAKAKD
jgi:hypothetical protein